MRNIRNYFAYVRRLSFSGRGITVDIRRQEAFEAGSVNFLTCTHDLPLDRECKLLSVPMIETHYISKKQLVKRAGSDYIHKGIDTHKLSLIHI